MRKVIRVFFPACATFGPYFMVTGLQGRASAGFGAARTGALMTSAALILLFADQIVAEKEAARPLQRRDALFWVVLVILGVLIWRTSDWLLFRR